MNEKKRKVITKPAVPIRDQAKFGKGRDWSGFAEFRKAHPTAAGGETWESYEAGLLERRNLNSDQETIRYAILDRKAAMGC